MAEVIISPIPTGTGAFNFTNRADLTAVHLSGGRVMVLYGQSSPITIYAHIATINNPTLETASVTTGSGWAFASNGSRVRAWRLNDNTVVALFGTDLVCLVVDENNKISLTSRIANFHTYAHLWLNIAGAPHNALDNASGGTCIMGHAVSDTRMIIARRTSDTSNAYTTHNVSFNTETKTITSATMAGNPFGHWGSIRMVPYNDGIVVYNQSATVGLPATSDRINTGPRIASAFMINRDGKYVGALNANGAGSTYTSTDTGPNPLTLIFPKSNGEFYGIQEGGRLSVNSTVVEHAPRDTVPSATGTWDAPIFYHSNRLAMAVDGVLLDDSHMIISMGADVAAGMSSARPLLATNGSPQRILVVRKYDKYLAVSNVETRELGSVTTGVNLNIDQGTMFWKLAENCYAVPSKANATATSPAIKLTIFHTGGE